MTSLSFKLSGITVFFLLIAGATACVKTPVEELNNKEGTITFFVSHENKLDVKSSLANGNQVSLSAGDRMSVFDGRSNNVFTTAEGGNPAMFSGTAVTGKELYYALSPYQQTASLNGESITASLPSSQTAMKGTFDPAAVIAVGTGKENHAIQLKNANSLLMFTINDGADVASVSLKSETALAGKVVINSYTGDVSSVSSSDMEMTMTGSFTPGDTYYFSVLPGKYTSLEFTCTDSKGNVTKSTLSSFTIGRNEVHNIGSIGATLPPPKNYLCFTAQEAGSIVSLYKVGMPNDVSLEVSADGYSWADYTFGVCNELENVHDKVYFRNKNSAVALFSKDYDNHYSFFIQGKVAASGSVMSLIDSELASTSVSDGCFYELFIGCCNLTQAPELPATTLATDCYSRMFLDCTSLVSAPELPATSLAEACYCNMFNGCTSLTKAPALPAASLAEQCYIGMFSNCSSLISAPDLPATALAYACYGGMFNNCTSLASAPTLPATTLAEWCYYCMFNGCTSLTQAPDLPATALAKWCYNRMFYGCSSLVSAPKLPANSLTAYCYEDMFYECSSMTSVPDLPATSLAESCYSRMFYGCSSLESAPALPATTLADHCYFRMFLECTSLTSAPALPATTLAQSCYDEMFKGCSSLKSSPDLPATTLAQACYADMFYGCSSLISAPALPATALDTLCYCGMFLECTSLVSAPTLPATNLEWECYLEMFKGCSSLTSAPALPATTLAPFCYEEMFRDCASLVSAPALLATSTSWDCYYRMFEGCSRLSYVEVNKIGDSDFWLEGVAANGTIVCPSTVHAAGIVTDGSSSTIPNGWIVVNNDSITGQ